MSLLHLLYYLADYYPQIKKIRQIVFKNWDIINIDFNGLVMF